MYLPSICIHIRSSAFINVEADLIHEAVDCMISVNRISLAHAHMPVYHTAHRLIVKKMRG